MNDDSPNAPVSPDDLAAYALDAHDADDAAAIAAHLDASPDDGRREQDLRSAAGEFAAAVVNEVTPAPGLRSRVLAEARRRREPAAVVAGSSPIDVHRVEVGAGDPAAARPDGRRLGPPGRPARARRLDRSRRRGPPGRQRDAAGPPAGSARCPASPRPPPTTRGAPPRPMPGTPVDRRRWQSPSWRRPPRRRPRKSPPGARPASTSRSTGGAAAPRRGLLCWCAPSRRGPTPTISVGPSGQAWSSRRRRRCSRWPMRRAASCRGRSPSAGGCAPDDWCDSDSPTSATPRWDVDLGAVGGVRPAGDDAVDAEIVTEAVAVCRGISARLDPRELDLRRRR